MLPAHWAFWLDRFPAVDAVGVEQVPARGGVASQDDRRHAYHAYVPLASLFELCELLSRKVALGKELNLDEMMFIRPPAHWAVKLDVHPAVDAVGVEELTARGGVASQDEWRHAFSANVP